MKKLNLFLSLVLVLVMGIVASAQTIDDVISKATTAMGGQSAIDGIKSLKLNLKGTSMDKEATMKILIVKPNCKLIQMSIGDTSRISATNGTEYWMSSNDKVMDMPEAASAQFGPSFNQYCGEGIAPLIGNGTFSYAGKEEVDGISADVVKGVITGSGAVTIYFDEAGLPFRIVMPTEKEGDLIMNITDYRDYGGMKMASKFESTIDGTPFFMVEIAKAEVNVDIDPSVFAKPAQ